MREHLASIVSLSRIVVAAILYVLIVYFDDVFIPLLFVCFFCIELSDILDGFVARRTNTVSDLGKLLDPICDVTAHFLCIFALQQVGLAPSPVVAIFILREIWVQMLRMQLVKRNVVLAAKVSGKIKTWWYGIAIFGSLLIFPGSILAEFSDTIQTYLFIIYYIAGATSLYSGLEYLVGTRKILAQSPS